MRFRKQKREVFIGSIRVNCDEETEDFLKAHVPVREWTSEDGQQHFRKWPDGRIEVESMYEYAMRLINDMKGRQE